VDCHSAFDQGLAGEGVALLKGVLRPPQRASAAKAAVCHLDETASAAALAAARLADLDVRHLSRVGDKCARGNPHRNGLG
jgi:hypothetical protein